MGGMELRIGDLSRRTGLAVGTLRYYADQGLFGKLSRTGKDYRLFPEEAVEWVRLLQAAQAAGFSLPEIRAMLGALRQGGICCQRMRQALSGRLASVRAQIRELEVLEKRIASTLEIPDGTEGPLPCSLASRLMAG